VVLAASVWLVLPSRSWVVLAASVWLVALHTAGRTNCSESNTRQRDMIRIGRNLII
jgi:hypothetical protein